MIYGVLCQAPYSDRLLMRSSNISSKKKKKKKDHQDLIQIREFSFPLNYIRLIFNHACRSNFRGKILGSIRPMIMINQNNKLRVIGCSIEHSLPIMSLEYLFNFYFFTTCMM
jgi:hypothetical protein